LPRIVKLHFRFRSLTEKPFAQQESLVDKDGQTVYKGFVFLPGRRNQDNIQHVKLHLKNRPPLLCKERSLFHERLSWNYQSTKPLCSSHLLTCQDAPGGFSMASAFLFASRRWSSLSNGSSRTNWRGRARQTEIVLKVEIRVWTPEKRVWWHFQYWPENSLRRTLPQRCRVNWPSTKISNECEQRHLRLGILLDSGFFSFVGVTARTETA
jgi:hypothetical protein